MTRPLVLVGRNEDATASLQVSQDNTSLLSRRRRDRRCLGTRNHWVVMPRLQIGSLAVSCMPRPGTRFCFLLACLQHHREVGMRLCHSLHCQFLTFPRAV